MDSTVALLEALAKRSAPATVSLLASEIGVARSSLNRIIRMLETTRVLERDHLGVGPGPAFDLLLDSHRSSISQRDALGRRQAGGDLTPRFWRKAIDPSSPLPLSPPLKSTGLGPFKLGFANAAMDNPWRTALVHSVERAASDRQEQVARLCVRHAENDPSRQAADIEDFLNEGMDGLIVSAVASREVEAALQEARDREVTVVLVDRGLTNAAASSSFVTTDDAFIGQTTALWLAESLEGRGRVLLLPGLAGAAPAMARLAAAEAVFAGFPDLEIFGTDWTGWRDDVAYSKVSRRIGKRSKPIDGVWCDSGLQSVGSMRAFQDAGFPPGMIPPHTGGDLNRAYKLAIKLGVKLGAVDYPPAMGVAAMHVLLASLEGLWIPQQVTIPCDIILSKGTDTASVKADITVEDHVRWDLPDDLILSSGLGPAYNPRAFRVHYPGNAYNRSAAEWTI